MKYNFTYLVEIRYLGFRYHGWQKQHKIKTVHDAIDKTLSFVLVDEIYKTLGIGRTDAMVSANSYYFQLFMLKELDINEFVNLFRLNAPQDISILNAVRVPNGFDLINHPKIKEYHYYFAFQEEYHPFAAPFITNIHQNLNINLMKRGAKLFEGEHFFQKYCTKPSKNTIFKRIIERCEIVENTEFTASFFPKKSYVLKIRGKGFLRYQIRLIMAMLFELGKENVSLNDILNSISEDNDGQFLRNIAPASGLQLYKIDINLN